MHYADLTCFQPVEIDHVTTKWRKLSATIYAVKITFTDVSIRNIGKKKLLEILLHLVRSSSLVHRQRLRLRSRSIHVNPIAYISACRYGSGNYIGSNDPWIIAGVTSTCE